VIELFPLPLREIERSGSHAVEQSETHRVERSEIRRRVRVRGNITSWPGVFLPLTFIRIGVRHHDLKKENIDKKTLVFV
jgi:hypothetical protein